MASPLSKGKAPKPRATDSPSPTDGVGGRAVLATQRRVRPSAREAWAAFRAESAGARCADPSIAHCPVEPSRAERLPDLGVAVAVLREIRIDVVRVGRVGALNAMV